MVTEPLKVKKDCIKGLIDEIGNNKALDSLYFLIKDYLDTNNERKSLIELRGNRSKEEVAKALNISIEALAAYENGERVPRDEVKVRLSKFYGVLNYYGIYIKNAAPTDQSKSCI